MSAVEGAATVAPSHPLPPGIRGSSETSTPLQGYQGPRSQDPGHGHLIDTAGSVVCRRPECVCFVLARGRRTLVGVHG